jgi:hypothetical protein
MGLSSKAVSGNWYRERKLSPMWWAFCVFNFYKYMKYLGYIWSMVLNVIILFFAISVLAKTNTPFEKIVVSILVLIFYLVEHLRRALGMGMELNMKLQEYQFARLYAVIKDGESVDNALELKKNLESWGTKQSIHSIIYYLFYAIIFILIVIGLSTSI